MTSLVRRSLRTGLPGPVLYCRPHSSRRPSYGQRLVARSNLASSGAVAAAVALPAEVMDLDPQSFGDFLATAGDSICVVDYYSDWCGPCQVMHKEVDKLTSIFKNVKFGKLNCGNCRDFSTRQRIRALPTFRLYHKGACLDELIGAKPVQLRQLLTHYSVMASIDQ